jgi:hypothetical protein
VYRIQYLCPRQGNFWQDLTEGFLWKTPRLFADPGNARMVCDSLIWQYHSARVLDPQNRIIYQV